MKKHLDIIFIDIILVKAPSHRHWECPLENRANVPQAVLWPKVLRSRVLAPHVALGPHNATLRAKPWVSDPHRWWWRWLSGSLHTNRRGPWTQRGPWTRRGPRSPRGPWTRRGPWTQGGLWIRRGPWNRCFPPNRWRRWRPTFDGPVQSCRSWHFPLGPIFLLRDLRLEKITNLSKKLL